MTLAVAVRFPFGRLARMRSQGLPLHLEEAMVLATDSRITSRGDGKVISDRGRKLFRIANDAGLVYSGDTAAARAAVRELLRYFKPGHRAADPAEDATNQVARILTSVYQREAAEYGARRRARVAPLDILVGVCSPHSGRVEIVFFSSRSSFVAHRVASRNLAAVGSGTDAERFEHKLHEMDTEQWEKYGPPPLEPEHWQIIVVAALYAVLEKQQDGSLIGGPIQTALITPRGFFVHEFAFVERDGDPLSAAAWTVTTIPPEETELVPRPWRRSER